MANIAANKGNDIGCNESFIVKSGNLPTDTYNTNHRIGWPIHKYMNSKVTYNLNHKPVIVVKIQDKDTKIDDI